MRLYGISMVRNEADIIRTNVLYHLSAGFDRILIFDDGSTDGTDRVLKKLARDSRVRWTSGGTNPGFRQGEVFTELARDAHREGADWVAPIDADDFWYARGGDLKGVLARSSAAVLKVRHIDFIQRREQRKSAPEGLLHMTMRVANPVARDGRHQELLEKHRVSYVELARVPKVLSRSSASMKLVKGAHKISGVGRTTLQTDELMILHAALRSLAGLEARAFSADRRGLVGSTSSGPAWHARRWRKLQEESCLKKEWAANSYKDGCLDVYGERHPLIFDLTFRDLVAPFVRRSLPERLLRKLLSQ